MTFRSHFLCIVLGLAFYACAYAVNRDLTDCSGYVSNTNCTALDTPWDCCTGNGTGACPTESEPFDLSACTLANDDDITTLLTDIADDSSDDNVYIQAPSSNLDLVCDSIDWAKDNTTISNEPATAISDDFIFLEHATNTLTITHKTSPQDIHVQWYLKNLDTIKIGGTNLNLTFQGLHPGLGTGETEDNEGHISVVLDSGDSPTLLDFRANVLDAHTYGLYVVGEESIGGTVDRFTNGNFSGLFWGGGLYIGSGVQTIWYDPDNLKGSDPYNRVQGWDGLVNTQNSGRDIGCYDSAKWQWRAGGTMGAQFADKIHGGVTVEYGTMNVNLFVIERIGNSASDPFVVKVKDYGASGPQADTGYPPGVAVKKSVDTTIMKHDPLPPYGHTTTDFRWIKFEQLASDYGNGIYSSGLTGCSVPQTGASGFATWWRPEASGAGTYETAYVHAIFDIDETDWQFGPASVAQLEGSGAQCSGGCGQSNCDWTWGHKVEVSEGKTITTNINMLDRNTLTGDGAFTDVTLRRFIYDSCNFDPSNNTIENAYVEGTITVDANSTGTIVNNVDFTGGSAGREIMDISGNSTDVDIDNICTGLNDYITCPDANTVITYNGQALDCSGGQETMSSKSDCDFDFDPGPSVLLLIRENP